MKTTQQFAQECLDLRGYVVVGCRHIMQIGEITLIDDQPGTASDIKGVVVAETDREDMNQQLRLMGENCVSVNCTKFYRVMAE